MRIVAFIMMTSRPAAASAATGATASQLVGGGVKVKPDVADDVLGERQDGGHLVAGQLGDLILASRSYQANMTVFKESRESLQVATTLGRG